MDVLSGVAPLLEDVGVGVDGGAAAVPVDLRARLERKLVHQGDVALVQQRVLGLRKEGRVQFRGLIRREIISFFDPWKRTKNALSRVPARRNVDLTAGNCNFRRQKRQKSGEYKISALFSFQPKKQTVR